MVITTARTSAVPISVKTRLIPIPPARLNDPIALGYASEGSRGRVSGWSGDPGR